MAVGSTTGTWVYTRLIAESFEQSRGLALTVVNCTPAIIAVAAMPALNWAIEHYGWRISYLAFGFFVLISGVIALALIPPNLAGTGARAPELAPGRVRDDFAIIGRSPLFWIIVGGFFLCVLGTPLHSSQMNMMLVGKGLTTQTAANVVSAYAIGTVVGRLACGLALDRFPTPYVTAASMFLPAIGLFLLASSLNSVWLVTFSMVLVGVYVGAESDILAYLVARYFKLRIYNSTLSLISCCIFLAGALGSGGISISLKLTDSFSPFMYLVSGTVFVGSLLFLLLPKRRDFEKIG